MSQRSVVSAVLLVSALSLLAWWYFRGLEPSGTQTPEPAGLEAVQPAQASGTAASGAPVAYADQTGYVAPDLATATPAEIQAIHDAEDRNSAASPPPRSFKGMDGKPKAFNYNDGKAVAEDSVREIRRQQLMQELTRDPRAFASKYNLSLKEVQWIVDGDTDFPDRLLLK